LVEKYMEQYYRIKANSKERMDKDDIVLRACPSLDFPEIGKFRVIDQDTIPIVCPHTPDSKKLIEEFKNTNTPWKYFQKLQSYTISVYPKIFKGIQKEANILEFNNVLIIDPNDIEKVYDEFIGINIS